MPPVLFPPSPPLTPIPVLPQVNTTLATFYSVVSTDSLRMQTPQLFVGDAGELSHTNTSLTLFAFRRYSNKVKINCYAVLSAFQGGSLLQ